MVFHFNLRNNQFLEVAEKKTSIFKDRIQTYDFAYLLHFFQELVAPLRQADSLICLVFKTWPITQQFHLP